MVARQPNPYRPGFNQPPPVLAGRDELLDSAREALETAAYDGHTPRPIVLIGPRGVGKTVLLEEIMTRVREQWSWPVVRVEATAARGLPHLMAARLAEVSTLLDGQALGRRRRKPRTRVTGGSLKAEAFGVGGEVRMERPPADAKDEGLDLDAELTKAAEAAVRRDAGVLIAIDELHSAARADLNEIAAVLQEHVPDGWPIVTLLAGLPSLRTVTRHRSRPPTYLERAEWHEVGTLDRHAATRALVEPAASAGRPLDPKAADVLLKLAGGYPYALQVAGHYAWRASHGEQRIRLRHATSARPRIEGDLAQLYTSRWEDASGREREYLQALAHIQSNEADAPGGGEVAAAMGVATTAVSYLRDRLTKKGTIYPDAHGGLHFITAGMGAWVREQHPRS